MLVFGDRERCWREPLTELAERGLYELPTLSNPVAQDTREQTRDRGVRDQRPCIDQVGLQRLGELRSGLETTIRVPLERPQDDGLEPSWIAIEHRRRRGNTRGTNERSGLLRVTAAEKALPRGELVGDNA